MLLFAGLGNKGEKYKNTRHNAGFIALDVLCSVLKFPKSDPEKFFVEFEGQKILCLKPQTYMNLSGSAAAQAVRFYKIPLENVFVFHDDIDLELGKIKFKIGGGAGGHNGLKSLDEHIGNAYSRIRIGVGRPALKEETADYVLSPFLKPELALIEQKLLAVFANLPHIIARNFSAIQI